MTIDQTIGTNVHELMWQQRKRQEPLMQAMGLSRSSLAKKLRGDVVWMARDIVMAAQFLDVEPGRLFDGAERAILPTMDTHRSLDRAQRVRNDYRPAA